MNLHDGTFLQLTQLLLHIGIILHIFAILSNSYTGTVTWQINHIACSRQETISEIIKFIKKLPLDDIKKQEPSEKDHLQVNKTVRQKYLTTTVAKTTAKLKIKQLHEAQYCYNWSRNSSKLFLNMFKILGNIYIKSAQNFRAFFRHNFNGCLEAQLPNFII